MRLQKQIVSLIFSFFLITQAQAQAQETGDTTGIFSQVDSTIIENQEIGTNQAIDTLFVRKQDTRQNIPKIGLLLNQIVTKSKKYAIELGNVNLLLKAKPDFSEMDDRIPVLKNTMTELAEVVIEYEEKGNNRFINGIENFLNLIEEEQQNFEDRISKRVDDLVEAGDKLDKIRQDTIISLTLKNSETLPEIDRELRSIQNKLRSLDSLLITQELEIASYQSRVSDLSIQLLGLRESVNQSERNIQRRSWKKEINYIWEAPSYEIEDSFLTNFIKSVPINGSVLIRFVEKKSLFLTSSLLVVCLIYFFSKRAIKNVIARKEFAEQILERIKLIQNQLFISCIIITIPFIFTFIENPTIVFSSLLSLVFVTLSGWIAYQRFPKKVFWLLAIFYPVYLVAPTFGLAWGMNFDERYFDLFVSASGITLAILMYKETDRHLFVGSRVLKALSVFLLTFALFSFGVNIFGRPTLAKTFSILGVSNFYRGIGLYLFVQVFLKFVYIWLESSKKEDDVLTSYFDFQEIQNRVEKVISIFAIVLWFYALTVYLGWFSTIGNSLVSFLTQPRTLGNLEYEFSTILLFIIILMVSFFLANNIAYFASVFDQKTGSSRNKRLGSSILLIRLAIITIGFFIAMAVAKIPLDKITIVLGALSVGIGFGLQTIINNLVSGIILAFERPVQIGDNIQVGQLVGIVQEVGIRASKIRAYDGSEIILPNGDLLSQSLINWTLSDKRRRIELIIGVAYGSDMPTVQKVLEEVLKRDLILKDPPAKVFMQEFGDNSVNFRLLFWVGNMDIWLDLRSEVMNDIFKAFKENNIEIPFPQRDLYLKSVPGNLDNVIQALEVKEAILAPKDIKDSSTEESTSEDEKDQKDNKKSSEE
ncbi:mechanosensitive ion channel family protein [Algoriphagus sediminis]|uniref:Mechanosensitive ion channel n=1 Tax=Algoriphagus sediminis TaxID=3057113 RepID=A0ABT7YGB5_9BACT|nr:mechanosensitive ion channel domain-containing protein [Algoriphagus sediminis]MDN3205566.1 mechanosensitive ion channel [Algoriphagus sediminis]